MGVMPPKQTIIVAVAIVFIGIQFIPVDQSNPPVTAQAEAQTPSNVKVILKRSCYDCHSNETHWPWYSRIAPMSWLVTHDVQDGREHMNFSTWATLPPNELVEKMEEVWEEVEEGEMPLWFYLPMHPEARLSDEDRAVLRSWATSGNRSETHGD